jgi:hypothetical protein
LLVPHVCEVHVSVLHRVDGAGQSVGALHATHAPAPLHTWPPLSLHVVPAAALFVPHVFEAHVLVLHSVVCAKQSVGALHATQLPAPLHTWPPLSLQVVPAAALLVPHMLEAQVLSLHTVVCAAQSDGALHPTHWPMLLHLRPPAPHVVPWATIGCVQLPLASHTSLVQGLPSSGQAVLAGLSVTVHPPLPSQVEVAWQLVGAHEYGVPLQAPLVHASLKVHALPSSQVVPLGLLDHVEVDVAGVQTWQKLLGLTAPLG